MNGRITGGVMTFEERRTWRLLLARLHPDAGGDQELFRLACDLRDGLRKEPRPRAIPASDGVAQERFLQAWREAMARWTVRNRNALRGDQTRSRNKLQA